MIKNMTNTGRSATSIPAAGERTSSAPAAGRGDRRPTRCAVPIAGPGRENP